MPDFILPQQLTAFPDADDLPTPPAIDLATLESFREEALASANRAFGLRHYTYNLHQPEPPWLINSFLQERAIHVISSAKGTGKTWLGLAILLAGRYGVALLGHESSHFGTVYVAADSPLWDIRRQLRKLIAGLQLPPDREAPSFLAPLGFQLENAQHRLALAQVTSTWNVKAIVFDVMLYVHGRDENNDREMSEIMKYAKFLRDNLGLAVVFLHHHGKTRGDARGADTILQACEHHYELRKSNGIINLHREKVRGEEDWTDIPFSLTTTPNGGKVLEVAAPQLVTTIPTTSLQDTIEVALAAGPQTRAALSVLAPSDKALDNALTRMRRAGTIFSPSRGVWQKRGDVRESRPDQPTPATGDQH